MKLRGESGGGNGGGFDQNIILMYEILKQYFFKKPILSQF